MVGFPHSVGAALLNKIEKWKNYWDQKPHTGVSPLAQVLQWVWRYYWQANCQFKLAAAQQQMPNKRKRPCWQVVVFGLWNMPLRNYLG